MNIRYLGHSAFALEHEGKTALVDPFLTGNPKAAASADDVAADAILLTHGHGDHLGDTAAIAGRRGCTGASSGAPSARNGWESVGCRVCTARR